MQTNNSLIQAIVDNHERRELFDDRSCLWITLINPSDSYCIVPKTVISLILLSSILDFQVFSLVNEIVEFLIQNVFKIFITRLSET